MILFFVFLFLAYLLGSVPFAYIFVKKIKGQDIRKLGSGNAGATNASRVLGKPLGMLVLILDVLKGTVSALFFPLVLKWIMDYTLDPPSAFLAESLWTERGVGLLMGLAAFIGHCLSPFLGFRGGKGVATALGVFLVIAWEATAITAVVSILIILLTRIVSVASITGAVLLPILFLFFELKQRGAQHANWFIFAVTLFLSVLVIFRHRSNIRRLLQGKENKA